MVIGLTSFGIGCGIPGQPSVYTRISSYLAWIEENVQTDQMERPAANEIKHSLYKPNLTTAPIMSSDRVIFPDD